MSEFEVEYYAIKLVCRKTFLLTGELVDHSSYSMNVGLNFYVIGLINAITSRKPVSTQPQLTDILIELALRHSTLVFMQGTI